MSLMKCNNPNNNVFDSKPEQVVLMPKLDQTATVRDLTNTTAVT